MIPAKAAYRYSKGYWWVVFTDLQTGYQFQERKFTVKEHAQTESAVYNEYYESDAYRNLTREQLEKTPMGMKIDLWECFIGIKEELGLPV